MKPESSNKPEAEMSQESSSTSQLFEVKWHQLWMVRAALLGGLIVAIGYFASLYVAIQGIQSITTMAFDPQVEELMDQHLTTIKQAHKLRQETFRARIARVMPIVYRSGQAPIEKFMIEKWIKRAQFDEYVDLNMVSVNEIKKEDLGKYPKKAIVWMDSATLKVRNFLISLPKEFVKKEFKKAEVLILRFRGIRANWTDEIQPTLVLLQIGIFVSTGILLLSSMILIFRKFKKNVDHVVDGFRVWSEEDTSFRFRTDWEGELRFLSSRFNHMADEVEMNRNRSLYLEKVASWQIIARKLAHEIKNPLTPIQMMVTQLVRRYKGDNEEFKSLLEDSKNIIIEEVTSLRRMVDNFSQFAQMPQPKLERQDLLESLRKGVELQKAGFPDNKITFESSLSEAFAKFDEHLLRQVIINLIKNAAEASTEYPAEITVTLERGQRTFRIVVRDNGPGVPEDLKSRIFEAYFTTKHSGPSPGMGLGLAVCQKVILEHGGDLKVESEPGDTRFIIFIPSKA